MQVVAPKYRGVVAKLMAEFSKESQVIATTNDYTILDAGNAFYRISKLDAHVSNIRQATFVDAQATIKQ